MVKYFCDECQHEVPQGSLTRIVIPRFKYLVFRPDGLSGTYSLSNDDTESTEFMICHQCCKEWAREHIKLGVN